MTLTRDLGRFVSDLAPNRVPGEAARIARTGFIDCIGVMFAGREEELTRLLRDVLQPPAGPATLCFTDTAPAPEAAWINGVAAYALDYDDVTLRGHPSTVLVPAIPAEAETLDLSGRDMVVAYVAGYEVWAELVGRESGYHHGKSWHPAGIFGAIAAAAACAYLRRPDPARTAQAIALGASQSAGLMANFGTMAKPFHAGRSAQSGVMAARLAAAGFSTAPMHWNTRSPPCPPPGRQIRAARYPRRARPSRSLQRPLKAGLRFLLNARTPSRQSSVGTMRL